MVWYYRDDDPYKFHDARLDLDSERVLQDTALPDRHCFVDTDEMHKAEQSVLSNPKIQDAVKPMDLPEDATVVVEPWSYSPDGLNDMSRRFIMVS